MVKFNLEIMAELENIKELYLDPSPETRIYLKLKCTNCGTMQGTSDDGIYLDGELHGTQNGQKANFVAKCKECKRENTVSILPNSYKKYLPPNEDSQPEYLPVVQFEARGLEPMDYKFRDGWTVKALQSGKVFSDISLEDLGCGGVDWVEYDDTTDKNLSVGDLKGRFVKVSG